MTNNVLEIPENCPEFKTLAEVSKTFNNEAIVEIVNRYVEIRRQQRKYMKAKLQKEKEQKKLLSELLKDPDVKAKLGLK